MKEKNGQLIKIIRFIEAAVFGSVLAASLYLLVCFLTIVFQNLLSYGDLSRLSIEWISLLVSPLTPILSAVFAAAGALFGLFASFLTHHRRLFLGIVVVIVLVLILPLTFTVILMIEDSKSLADAALIGTIFGLIAQMTHLPTTIPLVLWGIFLLEKWTRPKTGMSIKDYLPSLLTILGSICILFVILTQAYLPERPESRLDRLLLQIEGQRCDERRFPESSKVLSLEWSPTIEACQVDAGYLIGEMGPEAARAVPTLSRLVVERRDRDTGDGILSLQSSIAWALGEIGDPRAVDALGEALHSQDNLSSRVGRMTIKEALEKIRTRPSNNTFK